MVNDQLGTAQAHSAPVSYCPRPVRRIPHYRVHLVLSGLQLTFGTLCFGLGILSHSIDWDSVDGGSGYCGVPFFVAGLFGFLATRSNSVINKKCNFFACCLTFSVISSISSVIGISLSRGQLIQLRIHIQADLERSRNHGDDDDNVKQVNPHLIKLWIILAIYAVEFLVTIVHAGFVCASCCDQCVKREDTEGLPPPVAAVQPPAVAGTSSSDNPLLEPQQRTVLRLGHVCRTALPKVVLPKAEDQRPSAPPSYEETFPYEGPPLEDFEEFPRSMSP